MNDTFPFFQFALIGVGATFIMDLWAVILRRAFNIPSLDFALVGRWVLHMRYGQWFHSPISQAASQPGEAPLGWALHYAIGALFAITFGMMIGAGWMFQPTLGPAVLFGLLTVLFPFLIMQPAFGAGIAAARTPAPMKARIKSIGTHLVFGIGLWIGAICLMQI